MKRLKLIVNNQNKKEDIFFNKLELQIILNLYAKMVSTGEWKDYGLSISKREVSFNVYHRTSDIPVYKITKSLKPKNANEKYLIKENLEENSPKAPLDLYFCKYCSHVQLLHVVNPNFLWSNFTFKTSRDEKLIEHFKDMVSRITKASNLKKNAAFTATNV